MYTRDPFLTDKLTLHLMQISHWKSGWLNLTSECSQQMLQLLTALVLVTLELPWSGTYVLFLWEVISIFPELFMAPRSSQLLLLSSLWTLIFSFFPGTCFFFGASSSTAHWSLFLIFARFSVTNDGKGKSEKYWFL